MRLAARRDLNEPRLIIMARAMGAMWVNTGPLDGWCGWRGKWVATEIKNRETGHRLTEAQLKFLYDCELAGLPTWVWRDEADVLASLGAKIGA